VKRAFGVLVQEPPEGREKNGGVTVIAASSGGAEVVYEHLADLAGAALPVEQFASDRRRLDLGHVLVLHDRVDLVGVESAHRNAVLDRDHVGTS